MTIWPSYSSKSYWVQQSRPPWTHQSTTDASLNKSLGKQFIISSLLRAWSPYGFSVSQSALLLVSSSCQVPPIYHLDLDRILGVFISPGSLFFVLAIRMLVGLVAWRHCSVRLVFAFASRLHFYELTVLLQNARISTDCSRSLF